jgi:hypothetical protein
MSLKIIKNYQRAAGTRRPGVEPGTASNIESSHFIERGRVPTPRLMPSLPSRLGEVRYFQREINDTYILSEDVFRPGDLEEFIFILA